MKVAHFVIPPQFEKDVDRIVSVFESYGILIPRPDVLIAWGQYSTNKDAENEWDILPEKDEDIYLNIIEFLKLENF